MTQVTIEQAMQIAVAHLQAGRLKDVEAACQQILVVQPNHPDALHLLGLVAGKSECYSEAADLIRRAIAVSSGNPAYHSNLGIFLQKQGLFDDAIGNFRQAIFLNPNYSEAYYNLGLAFVGQGEFMQTFDIYEKGLHLAGHRLTKALQQQFAVAYNNLGHTFFNHAQLDQSIICYQRALALKPDYTEACYNLGNVWMNKDQLDQAISFYQRALDLEPDYAEAHDNLGIALQKKGRLDDAIAAHQRALTIQPELVRTHNNLGTAFLKKGQLDNAFASYQRALQIKPDYPEAHNGLGSAWLEKGEIDRAVACCQRALSLKPDYADAHYNLGKARLDDGHIDLAISSFQRALTLKPNDPNTYNGLGNAWLDKGQIDHAIASFQRALALKPDDPDAYNGLGNALVAKRDLAQAEQMFRAAIAALADHAPAHFNLGALHLLQGDYEHGLPLYEWRKKVRCPTASPSLPKPQWDGSDLAGRRILIHVEQGFGDFFQCVRYVPLIAQYGGKAILAIPADMKSLMQCLKPIEQLITLNDSLPNYDVHCPIMSLPLAFKTTLQNIPADVPYLKSDPDLARQWQLRLPGDNRLKVGLAWLGRRKPDPLRSVPPEELVPLATLQGVWFCSLQKPAAPPPHGLRLANFSDEIQDFADTAALIENLDLIITIDTSIAHLAGALGKQVWILLKYTPDWRWLLDRQDSPWYPTMRLFRQTAPGDWQTPIQQIMEELSSLAVGHRPKLGN